MARHREVASSPARAMAETWGAIANLVAVTLGRSASIHEADVRRAFDLALAAGNALVAGGHLARAPVTVIAAPLYLTISTVSGEKAFKTLEDENNSAAPGASTAETWMVYLPKPAGLASLIDEVVSESEHLSSATPPAETQAASTIPAMDLRRLDPARRS